VAADFLLMVCYLFDVIPANLSDEALAKLEAGI
jgi:hypothetical protein